MSKKLYYFWKWAFLVLLALIVGVGIFIFIQSKPNSDQELSSTTTNGERDKISISLNRAQLNDLSEAYLTPYQKNSGFTYHFVVGEKDALILGQTELLGQKFNYVLSMTPTVVSDGNIRLVANKLAVGSLRLPPKIVLSYIAKNYQLPKWIHISGSEAILRLNQLKTDNHVSYQANIIDFKNNKFEFSINVPKSKIN